MGFATYKKRLNSKSAALLVVLETRLDTILISWMWIAGLGCATRWALTPMRPVEVTTLFPYALLVLAPVASMILALRWFSDDDRQPQPAFRLARAGRWAVVSSAEARDHPLYGPYGFMASLLLGILINIPVRSLEYLGATPVIHGPIPAWLSMLHTMLTLDVVLLSSLYAIAFVAALRRAPLFPRLLMLIWMVDIAMQLLTAQAVAAVPGFPADVATPLQNLLNGNLKKVLISVALWLPYLLMSVRVNVTYRHRVPASARGEGIIGCK